MFKNFFKIAWRTILRNKKFSFINIAGLALGMTCCLFIFLWVQDEKSVDNFYADGENIFSVYQTTTANGKVDGSYSTPLKVITGQKYPEFLLEDVKGSVPEVKYQTYYATGYELPWGHPETFQLGEKKVKLEGSRAGKDFFNVFSYPIIEGNSATALNSLNGIAISRKMAGLFFGSPKEAIGKSLHYENKLNFVVTAVFEDLPQQNTFHFDFLFNWEAQKKLLEWASNDFQSYVKLSPTANVNTVTTKINQFLQPRVDNTQGVSIHLGLQQFGNKYLHSTFINGKPETGRIEYVKIFSGIAIFILLIACINFMNLATARSVKRAKEVGLRKVVGSSRAYLIMQFFGESLSFTFLAMLVSIVLLIALLPAFNHFIGKQIVFPFFKLSFWFSLICLVLITGISAGSYPALYLSSLKPVRILKGVVRFTQSSIVFRKGLTVFQFVLSISLIIATIVIFRQTDYVQNTDLGYNRDNLLYVRIEGKLSDKNKYLLFKNQLLNMPGIAMVDRSTEAPHNMGFEVTDAINWQERKKNTSVGFKPASVGFDFVKLMKLKMAEGRDFSKLNATDSTDAFLLNEEAVKEMGMKNPIGKWVSAWNKKGHVIGVLKNYHTQSLRDPIKPVIIDVKEYEYFGVIIIRIEAGKTKQAIASLDKIYKEINPSYPLAYQFVDQEYARLYQNELIVSKLSVLFSTIAILISSLGLLGLVMFSAEQRVKEIGIRKVLGASVSNIVALFSIDFLQLVFIAFIIAVPAAWYIMQGWLQNFAYRIAISWWIFITAGAATLVFALLIISFQSIKAALANPVKSLRTE